DSMCGICGAIGFDSKENGEAVVRRMLPAIVHRGPDEEGILVAPPVAAGTRRLSIIDLPGGSQPVWNETGTLAVVYNGEIYNFRELRQQLEASGHKFRTRSDTEVIVHAYEQWGEDCAAKLRGMFAFAVVELPQGRTGRAASVFLARDPLGIKPLYYTQTGEAFLFASEVRALLASRCVPPQLSAEAVPSYLLFGSVCEPATMVQGVLSLPPGHSLKIRADEPLRPPQPKLYWDFTKHFAETARAKGKSAPPDSTNAVAKVRSLLEDSVRGHLIADVPIGVFLSSGLDSTVIAALASQVQKGVHTFTVAFPDSEFSESEIARNTAQRLGTEHSELTLSSVEMVARLDEAVASFDQPSMDGINTFFVSWAARQSGLKVALSGLGSDELFGGYTSFRATSQVARIAAMAHVVPGLLRELATSLFKRTKTYRGSPDVFRKALAAWLDPKLFPSPYFYTRALFTPRTVAGRLGDDTSAWHAMPWMQWLSDAAREAQPMDPFTQISWLELRSYLVNTLLRDTDAMSMRHSLEVRVPFLDVPLVEYVLGVPESLKRNPAKPKSLLIDAMKDLLPEEVIAQNKRTFTFPWETWLRGKLGERVAVGLGDWSPALQERFDGRFALAVWRDFLRGRTTWSRPWSLYVLNEWAKRNLTVTEQAAEPNHKSAAAHVA
ncbi:MAG: asparagine synthase (glutamine-hydrolyzing), partial [Candidatus Acidiferrales bacterium]